MATVALSEDPNMAATTPVASNDGHACAVDGDTQRDT